MSSPTLLPPSCDECSMNSSAAAMPEPQASTAGKPKASEGRAMGGAVVKEKRVTFGAVTIIPITPRSEETPSLSLESLPSPNSFPSLPPPNPRNVSSSNSSFPVLHAASHLSSAQAFSLLAAQQAVASTSDKCNKGDGPARLRQFPAPTHRTNKKFTQYSQALCDSDDSNSSVPTYCIATETTTASSTRAVPSSIHSSDLHESPALSINRSQIALPDENRDDHHEHESKNTSDNVWTATRDENSPIIDLTQNIAVDSGKADNALVCRATEPCDGSTSTHIDFTGKDGGQAFRLTTSPSSSSTFLTMNAPASAVGSSDSTLDASVLLTPVLQDQGSSAVTKSFLQPPQAALARSPHQRTSDPHNNGGTKVHRFEPNTVVGKHGPRDMNLPLLVDEPQTTSKQSQINAIAAVDTTHQVSLNLEPRLEEAAMPSKSSIGVSVGGSISHCIQAENVCCEPISGGASSGRDRTCLTTLDGDRIHSTETPTQQQFPCRFCAAMDPLVTDLVSVRGCHRKGEFPFYAHLECALWCPEVFYDPIGGRFKKLEEGYQRASNIRCCLCGNVGAALGCCDKQCPNSYHVECARTAGAKMDEDTFTLTCPTHNAPRRSPHKIQAINVEDSPMPEKSRTRKTRRRLHL